MRLAASWPEKAAVQQVVCAEQQRYLWNAELDCNNCQGATALSQSEMPEGGTHAAAGQPVWYDQASPLLLPASPCAKFTSVLL